MRLFLRLWLALLLAAAAPSFAQTYPGTPVVTVAGNLSCGVRLYAANQVQTYCRYISPTAPITTVCNSLSLLNSSVPVAVSIYCMAADLPAKLDYTVSWVVQPMSDGSIQYQVAWQAQPCAPPVTALPEPNPLVGGCVSGPGAQPPASFQQGTLR